MDKWRILFLYIFSCISSMVKRRKKSCRLPGSRIDSGSGIRHYTQDYDPQAQTLRKSIHNSPGARRYFRQLAFRACVQGLFICNDIIKFLSQIYGYLLPPGHFNWLLKSVSRSPLSAWCNNRGDKRSTIGDLDNQSVWSLPMEKRLDLSMHPLLRILSHVL